VKYKSSSSSISQGQTGYSTYLKASPRYIPGIYGGESGINGNKGISGISLKSCKEYCNNEVTCLGIIK